MKDSTTTDPHDAVRQKVSEDYAQAVERTTGSCCGGEAAHDDLARLAGYGSRELAELPAEAVASSFGCGNPLAFSEIQTGDVVLDLGSGAGIDILLAAKKVGSTGRVIGVDMTDAMLSKARENIAAAGLDNVEVRKGLIEDLPVDNGSVDWVISNCVINLSPEKPKVFGEIARVLKPGGRMLVSDIVAEDLPEAVRQSAEFYSSCVGGAISETEYVAGLRIAGLENVEVRERMVYDGAQLAELAGAVEGDLAEGKGVCGCCGSDGTDTVELTRSLVGKVWSAQFFARKSS
jgi:SAM-dependent methyltransferase